jgi:CRISPR-associated endoribonuclease Cas6
MLCKINFSSKKNIVLPIPYNNIIQAVLYKFINEDAFADFMHNEGYVHNKRNYKLFTFSNIQEKPLHIEKDKKEFVFPKDVSIYFSSVKNQFFKDVFNSIINEDNNIYFGVNEVVVSKVELIKQNISEKETVKALSPITVYSTFTTFEDRKKTYYYSPYEKEFSENIRKNLLNKYQSIYNSLPEEQQFDISCKDKPQEKIVIYKNFIIKGYTGTFEIEGSKELMDMAFCTGLGSKNSQGFGLIVKK